MKKIFALFAGLALATSFTSNAQQDQFPVINPYNMTDVNRPFAVNDLENNMLALPSLRTKDAPFQYARLQHGVLGIGPRQQYLEGHKTLSAPVHLSKFAPAYRLAFVPISKYNDRVEKPFVTVPTNDFDNRVFDIRQDQWYQLAVAVVPGDGVSHADGNTTISSAKYVLVMLRDQETGRYYPKVVNRLRAELNSSLWKIEVQYDGISDVQYRFRNRETGLYLSLDLRDAIVLPSKTATPLADNALVELQRYYNPKKGGTQALKDLASMINIRVSEGDNDVCNQRWGWTRPAQHDCDGVRAHSMRLYSKMKNDKYFRPGDNYVLVASKAHEGVAKVKSKMYGMGVTPTDYIGYPDLSSQEPYYNVNLVKLTDEVWGNLVSGGLTEDISDAVNVIEIAPVVPSPIALNAAEFNSMLGLQGLQKAAKLVYSPEVKAIVGETNPFGVAFTAEDVNRDITNTFIGTFPHAPGMMKDLMEYNYYLKLKSGQGYLRMLEKWGRGSNESAAWVPFGFEPKRPIDNDHRSNFKVLYFPGNDSIDLRVLDARRPNPALVKNVANPETGEVAWPSDWEDKQETDYTKANYYYDATVMPQYYYSEGVMTATDPRPMYTKYSRFTKYGTDTDPTVCYKQVYNVSLFHGEGVSHTPISFHFEGRPVDLFFPNPVLSTVQTGLYFIKIADFTETIFLPEALRKGAYIVGDMAGDIVASDLSATGEHNLDQRWAAMPMTQWVVAQSENECTENPSISVFNREYIQGYTLNAGTANEQWVPANLENYLKYKAMGDPIAFLGAAYNSSKGIVATLQNLFGKYEVEKYRATWPYMDELQLYRTADKRHDGYYTLDFSHVGSVARGSELSVLNPDILYQFENVAKNNYADEAWKSTCGYLFLSDNDLRLSNYKISAYDASQNGAHYLTVTDGKDGKEQLFLNNDSRKGTSFQFLSWQNTYLTAGSEISKEVAGEEYGFRNAYILNKIQLNGEALPSLVRRSYVLKIQDPNKLDNNGKYVALARGKDAQYPTYGVFHQDVIRNNMLSEGQPKLANIYFKTYKYYAEKGDEGAIVNANARPRYHMIDVLTPLDNKFEFSEKEFATFLDREDNIDFNQTTKNFIQHFSVQPFQESVRTSSDGSHFYNRGGIHFMGYQHTMYADNSGQYYGAIQAYPSFPMKGALTDNGYLTWTVEGETFENYACLNMEEGFIGLKQYGSAPENGWIYDQRVKPEVDAEGNVVGLSKKEVDKDGNIVYNNYPMHYVGMIDNKHPMQANHGDGEGQMNYALRVIKPNAQYLDPYGINGDICSPMTSYLLVTEYEKIIGGTTWDEVCDKPGEKTMDFQIGKCMVSLQDSLRGEILPEAERMAKTNRYRFDEYTRAAFVDFLYYEAPETFTFKKGQHIPMTGEYAKKNGETFTIQKSDYLYIFHHGKTYKDALKPSKDGKVILDVAKLEKIADRKKFDGYHKPYLWMFRLPFFKSQNEALSKAVLVETSYSDAREYAPFHSAWLKQHNGEVVLAEHKGNIAGLNETAFQGELFTINTELFKNVKKATAAEDIVSGIKVITDNAQVRVLGAAGKNVVISNILGQTVANFVANSNDVTVNAPAGVVVVKVAGEKAVKAIVR